jgi:hypothetical protein
MIQRMLQDAGQALRCRDAGLSRQFIHGSMGGMFLYSFVRHRQGCRGNVRTTMADIDLEAMSCEQLIAEVMKLRDGIRKHRDRSGHELSCHHPALWALLPEKTDPIPVVPEWPQFIQGCVRYRQSLDEQTPRATRTSEPFKT